MTDLDDRLQDVRRALETMTPPADLWAEVLERADAGEGATPAHPIAGSRSLPRLLAVAAVVAVVALVSALVLRSDDQTVDTGPATGDERSIDVAPGPARPAPATVVSGHGCPFGVAGEPIAMERGPVDPASYRFDPEPGQNIAHTVVGSQVVEVRVPGFTLGEPDRWRMEDIELARGPARLWLDGPPSGGEGRPFVQVRWSSGSDEPCGSFTVTVDGGTAQSNRELAVALADRIVLPGEWDGPELPGVEGGPVAGLELAGTEWEVVSTGSGSAPAGAVVTFGDGTVTWEEGCATVRADYALDRVQGILTVSGLSSTDPGCTPPSVFEGRGHGWSDIRSVMETERIASAYILAFSGGAGNNVESLLRLGDPFGDHVVLAPVSGPRVGIFGQWMPAGSVIGSTSADGHEITLSFDLADLEVPVACPPKSISLEVQDETDEVVDVWVAMSVEELSEARPVACPQVLRARLSSPLEDRTVNLNGYGPVEMNR